MSLLDEGEVVQVLFDVCAAHASLQMFAPPTHASLFQRSWNDMYMYTLFNLICGGRAPTRNKRVQQHGDKASHDVVLLESDGDHLVAQSVACMITWKIFNWQLLGNERTGWWLIEFYFGMIVTCTLYMHIHVQVYMYRVPPRTSTLSGRVNLRAIFGAFMLIDKCLTYTLLNYVRHRVKWETVPVISSCPTSWRCLMISGLVRPK